MRLQMPWLFWLTLWRVDEACMTYVMIIGINAPDTSQLQISFGNNLPKQLKDLTEVNCVRKKINTSGEPFAWPHRSMRNNYIADGWKKFHHSSKIFLIASLTTNLNFHTKMLLKVKYALSFRNNQLFRVKLQFIYIKGFIQESSHREGEYVWIRRTAMIGSY